MRFIDLPDDSAVPASWMSGSRKRAAAVSGLITEEQRRVYIKSHAHWSSLKPWLLELGATCWYCESSLYRAEWDVDHFRPKRAPTIRRENHPTHAGYWWLAYEWRNFRISCHRCNRLVRDSDGALRGKGNEFPVRDEARRAMSQDAALEDEEPLLLDPCVEADTRLLVHTMDGVVAPAADVGSWEYERAEYTLRQLYIDDPGIVERKLERKQQIDLLLELVPRDAAAGPIANLLMPSHEFATFIRAAVATHRDIPWVDDLL